MFDTEAKKIFGKTAQQYVEEQEEAINNGEEPPEYPKDFEKLIGQKYAFVIKVSSYNIAHQIEQYSITMFTQDKDIMSALYKKFDIEKLEEIHSNEVIPFSDAESTNDRELKDDESDDELCEIDGPISSPLRKRQKMDVEDGQVGKDKIKLLIPKIEKD
ncbi:hypothetical protein M8C21_018879 [Ambrosia artemisiifolia]|uniref:Uncharacterized protein n=1 Tax=Ambrosia artemisiifolia TaxID=4212 RepID=A0AAD5G1G6_AMBAR|nr:hypothetical protein M8C21_018879 [Ambrosia artemisiifolia]